MATIARVLVALVVASVVLATVPAGALAAPAPGTAAAATGEVTTLAGDPPPGGNVTDDTRNLTFTDRYSVEVADVTYETAGSVDNVTVDLAGGSLGSIPASQVESVTVFLINTTMGARKGARTVAYDAHGTTLRFPKTDTPVDRIRIVAQVVPSVSDGVTMDATYTIAASGGTTGYDTEGVQRADTDARAFVRGQVLNQNGRPVENATVRLVNASTGNTVARLSTDENGDFDPFVQPVVPGHTYRVEVTKFGVTSETFSKRVFVERGETEDVPVTVDLRLAGDRLKLARADLGDPNATDDDRILSEPAVLYADDDSDTKATYVAIVENTSIEAGRTDYVTSAFEVDVALEFVEGREVGDFQDNDRIDKQVVVRTTTFADIDDDGFVEAYAPFEITADGANSSTMDAGAVSVVVRGSFTNALGNLIETTGFYRGENDSTTFANGSTQNATAPDGNESTGDDTATDGDESTDGNESTAGGDGDSSTGDGSGDACTPAGEDAGLNASTEGPSDDGLHQDVDGNCAVDVLDVQALFADLTGDRDAVGKDRFDFNGDGTVNVLDVQALFASL